MNLFIFPELARSNNGYGYAVEKDYLRLSPSNDDIVVWYTVMDKEDYQKNPEQSFIIQKNDFFSVKSVCNILLGKDRTELWSKELKFLTKYSFDYIFCGDTVLYRAVRKIFPNNQIEVRFHNCFARIYDRKRLLRLSFDFKFDLKLKNMYKLERMIFNDSNSRKIFISKEDYDYYTTMYGKQDDSELWMMDINQEIVNANRKRFKLDAKIVWYGGVESHKYASLEWFATDVFPIVKKAIPNVEFHLWGRGTHSFDNPQNGIFAHGFFEGDGVPIKNAIYINPDLIGGGVKIKLSTFLENGVPFITTPFGFEGYSTSLIDDFFCVVMEGEKWSETIINFIKNNKF